MRKGLSKRRQLHPCWIFDKRKVVRCHTRASSLSNICWIYFLIWDSLKEDCFLWYRITRSSIDKFRSTTMQRNRVFDWIMLVSTLLLVNSDWKHHQLRNVFCRGRKWVSWSRKWSKKINCLLHINWRGYKLLKKHS